MKDEIVENIILLSILSAVIIIIAILICDGWKFNNAISAQKIETQIPIYKYTCLKIENNICIEYQSERIITE